MSKGYKLYHRYLASDSKVSSTTVVFSEQSGSGALPSTTGDITPKYQLSEKSSKEVEEFFKQNYPLQYAVLRKKFDKKLKKLLKINEENSS